MSILNANRASDVLVQEINLSQVITSSAVTVSCQVIVSKQGSTKPKFWTSGNSYLAEYGNPDATVSFNQYCGIDFFREGNSMWAVRAVHSDAKYSGVVLYSNGTTSALYAVPNGISGDPTDPNWIAISPAGSTPLALFYPSHGQGSYGNNTAIQIVSTNTTTAPILGNSSATPPIPPTSTTNTGGVLPAATYEYQVSAIMKGGAETLASNPGVQVIAGASSQNTVTVNWQLVQGAVGYRIYGRTQNGLGLIATVGATTTTYTDTGNIVPDVTHQPITSISNLSPATAQFTVNVFDMSVNPSTPRESFVCTLGAGVDGDGASTELTDKINPFSQYIQVTSNVPNLNPANPIPTVTSVSTTQMTGGDSGSPPDDGDIIAAMQVFADTQLYNINMIENDGRATPAVQLAIDALVQKRQDAIGILDVPSAKQKVQDAIDYRNLQLNLNSSYSALFTSDVLEQDTINGKQLYVPISGWIAALCARTDKLLGPGASIAGLNRGQLQVLKTRYTYNDGDMTALYQAQVNYPRMFAGQGTALWEQRTLAAQQSAVSWLSVRRILNVLKKSLKNFLFYSLQEWNDDFTARQIITSCSQYLQAVQDSRQITSYNVSVSASAAERNAGILNVNVIIVPAIPIHIIQLNVIVAPQGVTFSELLQSVNGTGSNQ